MSARLLLWCDICSTTVTPFLKSFFIPGLYSGIFVLHLQIHAKEADSRKQNIVFHALWVLYLLSAALMAIDTATFVAGLIVSENEHLTNVVLISLKILQTYDDTSIGFYAIPYIPVTVILSEASMTFHLII